MTKEELEKEAIQYAVDYPTSYGKGYKHKDLRIAYLAGAEPREKRIADLEAYNEKLLTSDIEKHNKIVELEAQVDNLKSIGKTAYIKGIRTMANALKDYDRTEGAWTDYFEHKVDETLKMLLKKGVIKENLTTVAEYETQELLNKQIEATYKVVEKLNKAKEIISKFLNAKSIEETCVAESEAEKFLKEEENA